MLTNERFLSELSCHSLSIPSGKWQETTTQVFILAHHLFHWTPSSIPIQRPKEAHFNSLIRAIPYHIKHTKTSYSLSLSPIFPPTKSHDAYLRERRKEKKSVLWEKERRGRKKKELSDTKYPTLIFFPRKPLLSLPFLLPPSLDSYLLAADPSIHIRLSIPPPVCFPTIPLH